MLKILIGSLLALTAANSVADNVFIYEDNDKQALITSNNEVEGNVFIYDTKQGQALLTNVSNPSGNFDKFTKKVKVTYYKDKGDTSSDTLKRSSNGSYANSAFDSLR